MDNKYFTIFDLLKEELDLDDKESILKSEDPKLAKWYSVIALLGMSAKEVGKGAKSGDELRENLNNALLDGYRNTDEMKKELDNALEILRKTIADNTIILGKYTSNYQIAIRALTDSNEAKDKIIEDRDETIRRLRREKVEKTLLQAPNKAENAESAENAGNAAEESPDPGKGGKADRSERIKDALGILLKRPNKVSEPSGRTKYPSDGEDAAKGIPDAGKHIPDGDAVMPYPDGDAAKPSPDGDAGTAGNREDLGAFIDDYVNNEEYSDEARSYLLDCYQSGTPLDVIRQFARPQFSVKILKRLKKIYERRRV